MHGMWYPHAQRSFSIVAIGMLGKRLHGVINWIRFLTFCAGIYVLQEFLLKESNCTYLVTSRHN